MASFTCPHCHHSTSVFSSGGVEREAKKHNIPILGSVPLNEAICLDADLGKPSVVSGTQSGLASAEIFREIAKKILTKLELS
jgi:ATP-binding protein involved in chromosome partitioning